MWQSNLLAAGDSRVYRYGVRDIIKMTFPYLLVLIVLASIWFVPASNAQANRQDIDLILGTTLAIILPLIGIALYGVRNAYRSTLVLFADAVELRTPRGARRLERRDIAGIRTKAGRNAKPAAWIFVAKDPMTKPLEVASAFQTDQVFAAWIAELPDLDAADRALALEEVYEKVLPGRSREEQLAFLSEQRRAVKYFLAGVAGVAVAYFFEVGTLWLGAVLFSLPWIGMMLAAASRGAIGISIDKKDPRPNIGLGLLIPAFALFLGPPYGIQYPNSTPLIWPSALMALLVTGMLHLADPQMRRLRPRLVFFFAIWSCLGSGWAAFDSELDNSAGGYYTTMIVNRSVHHGRHTTYHLTLAPWGPIAHREDITVPWSLYEDVTVNEAVCTSLHPGALGVPWYTVSPRCAGVTS